MERFRPYLGKKLNLERIKNPGELEAFDVTCTYLPDPPADFDEFEFRTDFLAARDLVITLAVEKGEVKRVMFGLAGEDPEDIRSLTRQQLDELLLRRGARIEDFLAYVTG